MSREDLNKVVSPTFFSDCWSDHRKCSMTPLRCHVTWSKAICLDELRRSTTNFPSHPPFLLVPYYQGRLPPRKIQGLWIRCWKCRWTCWTFNSRFCSHLVCRCSVRFCRCTRRVFGTFQGLFFAHFFCWCFQGDVISVISKSEGWWTGEVNGMKGLFPSNYVKEVSLEEAQVVCIFSPPNASNFRHKPLLSPVDPPPFLWIQRTRF